MTVLDIIRDRKLQAIASGADLDFWSALEDLAEAEASLADRVLDAVAQAEKDLVSLGGDLEAVDIVDALDGIRGVVS